MAKIGSSNDHQRQKRMVRAGNKLVRESAGEQSYRSENS